jgi:hypothetical protein
MTDIYFPVEKISVEELHGPDYEHPSGISHAIVVTKPDGVKRVVQYCSDIYFLLPNSDIIPKLEEELSKFFKVRKEVRMNQWSRFFIDFILEDKSFAMQGQDIVFPKLRTINSYDGAIRYHYQAGFYRQICANGMMGWEWDKGIKQMHTPKIGKETSFAAIMEMTSEFLAESSDVFEVYRELQDQPVKDWMLRIEEVTEETAFPVSLQEDVSDRMGHELDTLKVEANDWLIYNAFNYQLNHHDGLKAKQSKKDTFDQEVLGYLLKY